MTATPNAPRDQHAPSDMTSDEFRAAGHRMIDALADFYAALPDMQVTPGRSVDDLRRIIGRESLPSAGQPAADLLEQIAPILFRNSLHNGHPRFMGYITSSAAPLGALAELLAAGINQNCGLRDLSPAANEIERQTIAWLAELIGFPADCGGIMVSGGNMANILGFLAARQARLSWDVRREGLLPAPGRLRVYASRETHTWIEKAADIAGFGTDAIRWLATDAENRLDPAALDAAIAADRDAGDLPLLVVGTAGNVSTGAIDPLDAIAAIARQQEIWFHVDGAYGAPAACLPESPASLKALALADSVALDPHKWLYAPIEAATILVRDPEALRRAFSFRPAYYRVDAQNDGAGIDYFEHGLQNTRGFRALKVWLGLRQAGRRGYEYQIRHDIALARQLFDLADAHPMLEAGTNHLSITTFRYRPAGSDGTEIPAERLDRLNERLLARLQRSGEAYLSNAIIGGRYFLRACIVNFRTRESDIQTLIQIVLRIGTELETQDPPVTL